MIHKHRRKLLPIAALALTSVSAHALQLIEARDGVSVEATISVKEATRIRIDGTAGKIVVLE